MKKQLFVGAVAAFALSSVLAGVEGYGIEDLKLTSRLPWETLVDISFEVVPPQGATAKWVELNIVASNGVDEIYVSDTSISTRLAGTSGRQHITWSPATDHSGMAYGNLKMYVSVKAEIVERPPIMLVNLKDGSVSYAGLSATNAVKRNFMLRDYMMLRHIPATTSDEWKAISGGADFFWFGAPERDAGWDYKSDLDLKREDRRHKVTLTKGFYMGVYPLTRGQVATLGYPGNDRMNLWMETATGLTYEKVRGADVRGAYCYPETADVDPNSIIGKIRAMTGLKFDLPTNFQWEYAARAGNTNAYLYTETDVVPSEQSLSSIKNIRACDTRCNRWGLYGMIGCCHQWTTTLGRTTDNDSSETNFYKLEENATDPVGPAPAYDHGYRITRGSHHGAEGTTTKRGGGTANIRYRVYRIAYKYPMKSNNPAEFKFCGVRLCLTDD